jgi:hypothetical protein
MTKVNMPWLGINNVNMPANEVLIPEMYEQPQTETNVQRSPKEPAPLPHDQPAVGGTTGNPRNPSHNTGGGSMSGTPKM